MEKNNKIPIILIVVIAIVAAVGISSFAFSDDASVNVELDGENVTVDVLAFPSTNALSMRNEMTSYLLNEMNDIDAIYTTIDSELIEIAKDNGFENIDININSQFGENQIPMIITVDGTSMVPTLKNGENVIIVKTKNFKVGDIVVAKDPEYGLLIKRIGKINGDKVFLSADNNDTETIIENGVPMQVVSIEKWTTASNIVGVAKIFDI